MTGRLFALIAFAASACDGSIEDGSAEYACEAPTHAAILKRDEIRSTCFDKDGNACQLVGIAVAKDVPTPLLLGVYDDEKRECDPAETEATVDNEDFEVVNDGHDLIVTARKDVFDVENAVEPTGTLTVRHGNLVVKWQVMAMIDLEGRWEITVDGLTVGDFSASQSGRFIRWAECDPSDTRPECSSGLLFRAAASLYSPIGGLKLDGTVASTRDRIDGTWTNGGQHGAWYAVRAP